MNFSDDGYQIFQAFFPGDRIRKAREAVAGTLKALRPGDPLWNHVVPISVLPEHRNPGIPRNRTESIPFVLNELPRFSTLFRELILDAGLWSAAGEILQTESVVYHFANLTRKPARVGPNLSWHRDYPNEYICPEDSSHFFRALIPLGPMRSHNGCTRAIPFTHRVSDERARWLKEEKQRDFEPGLAIDLCAESGDLIAIHPKLVHGGRENRSEEDRDLLVVQFGIPTDRYLYEWDELYSGLSREEIARCVP